MKILAFVMLAFLLDATRAQAQEPRPPAEMHLQAKEAMARRRIRMLREYLDKEGNRELRKLTISLLHETIDMLEQEEAQRTLRVKPEARKIQVEAVWHGDVLGGVTVTDVHDPAVPSVYETYQIAFLEEPVEKRFRGVLDENRRQHVVLLVEAIPAAALGQTTLVVTRVLGVGG